MRNMYDYAYEYEYQYHPERAGEMFAVVFASLWLAIMIECSYLCLEVTFCILFGLYTIAKRMGKKMHGWHLYLLREHITTEYGRSDPTEKYDDQKIRDCGNCFFRSSTAERSASMYWYCIWHRNDARRKCGESKCDRGGDERTCVFFYVFRSDHCFDLIRSSSDRFERLGE